MRRWSDFAYALIIGLSIVAVVAICVFGIYRLSVNASRSEESLVRICVESGGSWVKDGGNSECWTVGPR